MSFSTCESVRAVRQEGKPRPLKNAFMWGLGYAGLPEVCTGCVPELGAERAKAWAVCPPCSLQH